MSQQTQLAAQLSALREKINQGQIFQSLGTEIGKLATSVKKKLNQPKFIYQGMTMRF